MRPTESREDYLETIYRLNKEKGYVRSIDVAETMGVTKPSVSRAMSLLRKEGCITVDDTGAINLTDAGFAIAHKILERHTLLTRLLVELGVDETIAAEDACKIEHAISDTSFEAIKRYMRKLGRDV